MIKLVYLTCRKTDLVTVGGVACRRGGDDLSLRELTLDGVLDRHEGICRTGNSHCRIYVASARKGVTDSAADTGCRAAEGLDLGGMVVCFVLEEKEPVFVLAVNGHLYLYGTRVDLLGFVELVESAFLLEDLCRNGADVHEVLGLGSAERGSCGYIVVVSLLEELVLKAYLVNSRIEGRVSAVVRPVGIDHLDLGHSGTSALGLKVLLAECRVVGVHSEGVVLNECLKTCSVKIKEAVDGGNLGGYVVLSLESGGLLEGCLAALYRVDNELLDSGECLVTYVTVYRVYLCGAHGGSFTSCDKLNALCRGVCSLIELTGEVLYRKDLSTESFDLSLSIVHLRLGEYGVHRVVEERLIYALDVISIDNSDCLNLGKLEQISYLFSEGGSLVIEAFLLFYIYSVNHTLLSWGYLSEFSVALSALAPMSWR